MLTIGLACLILCGVALIGSVIATIEERNYWWFVISSVLLITFFCLFKITISGQMIPTPLCRIHPYI